MLPKGCSDVLIPATQNLLIGTKLNTTGLERVHIRLLGNLTLKPDVRVAIEESCTIINANDR
jgi:hypothetical protein